MQIRYVYEWQMRFFSEVFIYLQEGFFFMPLWRVEKNPGAVEAFVFYRVLGVACAKLLTKIRH